MNQVQKLQNELAEIEARREQAIADIAAAKSEGITQMRDDIEAMIGENGYTLEEIFPELADPFQAPAGKSKRVKKKQDGAKYPAMCLKLDETKVYTRGPQPTWLKEAIIAEGMDPSIKADRDAFREKFMRLV